MYWTDLDADRIERANLDGGMVEPLIAGLGSGRSIALDVQPQMRVCTLDLNLRYDAPRPTLDFRFGTVTPATWRVWIMVAEGEPRPIDPADSTPRSADHSFFPDPVSAPWTGPFRDHARDDGGRRDLP
jgi:hypothetical protein